MSLYFVFICSLTLIAFPSALLISFWTHKETKQNKTLYLFMTWQSYGGQFSQFILWRWAEAVRGRCLSPPMPLSTAFLVFKLCLCIIFYMYEMWAWESRHMCEDEGQFSRDEILLPHGIQEWKLRASGILGRGLCAEPSHWSLTGFQVSVGCFHYFFREFLLQFSSPLIGWFACSAGFKLCVVQCPRQQSFGVWLAKGFPSVGCLHSGDCFLSCAGVWWFQVILFASSWIISWAVGIVMFRRLLPVVYLCLH